MVALAPNGAPMSTTASPSSPNHAIQRSMPSEDGSSGVWPPWNISTNFAISVSRRHTVALLEPPASQNPERTRDRYRRTRADCPLRIGMHGLAAPEISELEVPPLQPRHLRLRVARREVRKRDWRRG